MSICFEPAPIRFYVKKGIQFMEPFKTLDKSRRPITVAVHNLQNDMDSIVVKNARGDEVGNFDLMFKKGERTLEGHQLFADVEGENIGEILTLSSLVEFSKNGLNYFKLKSLKETIPFYARYGFILDNKDPDFILNGLRQIMKTKAPQSDDFRYSASFFYPKIKNYEEGVEDDKFLFLRGCKVISNFLAHLTRNRLQKYTPELISGSRMKYTDWETETNRIFLNQKLREHDIGYKM